MFLKISQNSQENTCASVSLQRELKGGFDTAVFQWILRDFKSINFIERFQTTDERGAFLSCERWSDIKVTSKWNIHFFPKELECCFSQVCSKYWFFQVDQVLPKGFRGPAIFFFSLCYKLKVRIDLFIYSESVTGGVLWRKVFLKIL